MRAIETFPPADIPTKELYEQNWHTNCNWFCDWWWYCHLLFDLKHSLISGILWSGQLLFVTYPLQSTWMLSIWARAPDITRSRTTSISLCIHGADDIQNMETIIRNIHNPNYIEEIIRIYKPSFDIQLHHNGGWAEVWFLVRLRRKSKNRTKNIFRTSDHVHCTLHIVQGDLQKFSGGQTFFLRQRCWWTLQSLFAGPLTPRFRLPHQLHSLPPSKFLRDLTNKFSIFLETLFSLPINAKI